MVFYLFLAAFGTIFLAELLGDKTIYTIGTLAARFSPVPVLCGVIVAFMGKMLVAVLIGQALAELPAGLVAGVSTVTFLVTAVIIWFKRPGDGLVESRQSPYWSRVTVISFAAVFFSEWGDVGQITAATLVARYQAPLIVWLGATLALTVKGVLAMTLGISLRKRVSPAVLKYGAFSLCLVLGMVSASRLFYKH